VLVFENKVGAPPEKQPKGNRGDVRSGNGSVRVGEVKDYKWRENAKGDFGECG